MRRRFIDETGKKYKWLSVERYLQTKNGHPLFQCRCECGRFVIARGSSLRSGNTTSCGRCSRVQSNKAVHIAMTVQRGVRCWGQLEDGSWLTACVACGEMAEYPKARLLHGYSPICSCSWMKGTFVSWRRMLDRYKQRKEYRKRGVCDRWQKDFWAFYHDVGKRDGKNLTIERKNNTQGYFRENCYWATRTDQARNRGKKIGVTVKHRCTPDCCIILIAGASNI